MIRKGSSAKTFQRKETDPKQLTSERIERDLETFRNAGGRIEVLGVTQVLKKLDQSDDSAATPMRSTINPHRKAGAP